MRRSLPWLLVCGAWLWPASALRAAEPPAGEARLASGRVVNYTIHFDRNSLQESVRLDDGLIALTSSGTLLRFDLPAVALGRERIDGAEVTCLGRGEGGAVLAGLADGRVCRVDPATLALTDVARLSAPPQWIGWAGAGEGRPAGLVVVTRPTRPVAQGERHWDVPYSVVNDLATGKTFALEIQATAFLLDRTGRLWLGADRGEWGGRIWRVDLAEGKLAEIAPPSSRDPRLPAFWQGIYGFVALRDGQVWAFGGTAHMGIGEGTITRVDTAAPRVLYSASIGPIFEEDAKPPPKPDRPRVPITHVVEEADGLLVFAYSDVFRVDRALQTWKLAGTLEIDYRWGRPDAVGAYPAVQAVHPPARPGGPYVLATVADGYVVFDGAKASPRALPGQLGVSSADWLENTAEGTVVFERDDRLAPWRLGPKGWETIALEPPFDPDPNQDEAELESEKDDAAWHETRVLVAPGGAIVTVSATNMSPGTRTTARREGGKTRRIGREVSSLNPSASFLTADGTLWNTNFGELLRFDQGRGRWRPLPGAMQGRGAWELRPLNPDGPPWLLLNPDGGPLWRLEAGPRGANVRLGPVDLREGGKPLRVSDAIPWTKGSLLLSTDAGLRVCSPSTLAVSHPDPELPVPPDLGPTTAMTRDGLGRLWLGNARGLWLVEPGAKSPEPLDRVPWVGRSEVADLAPDPHHPDGVIAALGTRGVASIRAGRRP